MKNVLLLAASLRLLIGCASESKQEEQQQGEWQTSFGGTSTESLSGYGTPVPGSLSNRGLYVCLPKGERTKNTQPFVMARSYQASLLLELFKVSNTQLFLRHPFLEPCLQDHESWLKGFISLFKCVAFGGTFLSHIPLR